MASWMNRTAASCSFRVADQWRPPRRTFLGIAAATLGLGGAAQRASSGIGLLGGQRLKCTGEDPVGCILIKKFDTLVALVEAQLLCLGRGCLIDEPAEIACDIVEFVRHLAKPAQQAVCLAISGVEFHCWKEARQPFDRLSPTDRRRLLNQGEYGSLCDCPRCRREAAQEGYNNRFPLIRWENDFSLHTSIGLLLMLVRLVTFSRPPARQRIGFHWSPQCRRPENLATVPAPPYPDLQRVYDVCVVGSGAGGALVAARAAEAGLRVLIVEEGEWISPSMPGLMIPPVVDIVDPDHLYVRAPLDEVDAALEMLAGWSGFGADASRASLAKISHFDADAAAAFFDIDAMQLLLGRLESYFARTDQPFPLVTHEDLTHAQFVVADHRTPARGNAVSGTQH